MLRFLVGVVVTVLVFVAVVWLVQRRLIYFPSSGVPSAADHGWEEAEFTTDDGLVLHGWFVPPGEGAPVVVIFNGNAGNRAGRIPLGSGLAAEGLGVLLFDYRGFGDNPGNPTSEGLALDARAAAGWVRDRAGGAELVYFGESLGAAVAAGLAVEQPPAALVLRSPFVALADLASLHYPLIPARLLLRDEYPARDYVAEVSAPTLVIAGDADQIVPVTQSRAVFDAAPEPKELMILPGARHNDFDLVAGPDVIEATVRFVQEHTGW